MSESHLYTFVIGRNRSTVRLGWISASTGLTYCGICLRAPVEPEIGAVCPVCDARVLIFDLRAGGGSMKQAWKDALMLASAGPETSRVEPSGL